jgi:hypothetical protein
VNRTIPQEEPNDVAYQPKYSITKDDSNANGVFPPIGNLGTGMPTVTYEIVSATEVTVTVTFSGDTPIQIVLQESSL